ncbi:MAG: agmatine deiminase family protein [Planctomycetaceae bacterium]
MSAPIVDRSPRDDGFAMPAEWGPHQATLLSWPTRTRAALWGELFEEAERDYAAVANAIADFEPVVVVVDPPQASEARAHLRDDIEVLPNPIDDSWIRDNGPIFVTDGRGRVAAVDFRFNGWGGRYEPYDRDDALPAALAAHFGVDRYEIPLVLEGGAFGVDGEGTLLTTEQCLLSPNRNPTLSRGEIEETLKASLGVDVVVWMPHGWSQTRDTDGHVDGIALFAAPGHVLLLAPAAPGDPDHPLSVANRAVLEATPDARGRAIQTTGVDPGAPADIPLLNVYLANGAVIAPTGAGPADEVVAAHLRAAFPDREVVQVPGRVLHEGGGGPHCITQQVPAA